MAMNASPGASYGWRARIGFIIPSPGHENNCYEFYLIAPEGVTICLTSFRVMDLTQEQYDSALERLAPAMAEMEMRKADGVVQAGVPLIVTHGWGFEEKLREQISKITKTPLATDIGSCIKAMQVLEMKRVVMLTPFDDEMHGTLTRYVANAGIEVVAAHSVLSSIAQRNSRWYEVSTMPLSVPFRAAKELFRSVRESDGVWITGALMPSVVIIEVLEKDLGVSVVSSMQAMTWAGLRLAGVHAQIYGYGRLFNHL